MAWYTYILRCSDGSLYTGITTDPVRRLAQHRSGKSGGGAKYTASRRPLAYECLFMTESRSSASALEARIKKLSHEQKLELIAGGAAPPTREEYTRLNADPEGHIL